MKSKRKFKMESKLDHLHGNENNKLASCSRLDNCDVLRQNNSNINTHSYIKLVRPKSSARIVSISYCCNNFHQKMSCVILLLALLSFQSKIIECDQNQHQHQQIDKDNNININTRATQSRVDLQAKMEDQRDQKLDSESVPDGQTEPDGFDEIVMLQPESLYNSRIASRSPSINLLKNMNGEKHDEQQRSRDSVTSSRFKRSINQASTISNQQQQQPQAQLTDACPSKVELITPYYATNSKGKLRTLVHSELMQQAIQVETCQRTTSNNKCNANQGPLNECGCEQKFKWHRLLVFDPANSQRRTLFMDWFLFPSSCVCRCRTNSPRQFLKAITHSNNAPSSSTTTTATTTNT